MSEFTKLSWEDWFDIATALEKIPFVRPANIARRDRLVTIAYANALASINDDDRESWKEEATDGEGGAP